MILRAIQHKPTANVSYLIADDASLRGAVIDPSYSARAILSAISELGLHIDFVLNTHGHRDHCTDNTVITAACPTRIAAHSLASIPKDLPLEHDQIVPLGALEIRVIHTPGHTPDSVCFLVEGRLFTGDTLFVGECGRTDLPGGDAGILHDSLFGKLVGLPDDTLVLPGHDYGPRPTSTIGEERRTNYVLKPRTRSEFIAFMTAP
jgi:glyoxylase-like metal-dependent hydrolase (beta-lactamase superfamily II)